jgi:hypothetical protein
MKKHETIVQYFERNPDESVTMNLNRNYSPRSRAEGHRQQRIGKQSHHRHWIRMML